MIETEASVVATEPGYAWVECERRSGCGHCAGSDNCGVSSLGQLFGARRMRLRLPDPVGVQRGDEVVIGLSESGLVAAAAAAYLLPLAAMIGAALAGEQLGQGQWAPILAGLAGFVGGLWLVRRRANAPGRRRNYRPVLLRRQVAGQCTIEFGQQTRGVRHE
jgi:sigma-E factor negative regulatory protein RseC